jgi:hypothetical protein
VPVQVLKLIAGDRERRRCACGGEKLKRRRLDPLAPVGAGKQGAHRRPFAGDGDAFQRLADERLCRQAE